MGLYKEPAWWGSDSRFVHCSCQSSYKPLLKKIIRRNFKPECKLLLDQEMGPQELNVESIRMVRISFKIVIAGVNLIWA